MQPTNHTGSPNTGSAPGALGEQPEVVEQEAITRIRAAAFQKWQDAGCPECDGVDFWLAAEHEYLEAHSMPDPSDATDLIQEASEESFPASDAPAWGGSRRQTTKRAVRRK